MQNTKIHKLGLKSFLSLGLSIYIDLKHQTHARPLKKNYFKRQTIRKAMGSGVKDF